MIKPELTQQEKQVIKDNLNTTLNTTEYLDDFFKVLQNLTMFPGNIVDYMLYKNIPVFSKLKLIPDICLAYNCKNVEDLYVPQECIPKDTFCGCANLTNVSALNATTIEKEAFSQCCNLHRIQLSTNLIRLGHAAFKECKKLRTIVLPNSLQQIDSNCFSRSGLMGIDLFNTLITDLNFGVFYKCTWLKNINFPENLQSINDCCFKECSSLEKVDLSYTPIKMIDSMAFMDCKSLQSVKIPSTVNLIKFGAFSGCYNLQYIEIPEKFKNDLQHIFEFVDLDNVEIKFI